MKLTQRLFLLAFVALLPAIAIQIYNELALRAQREAELRDLAQRSALQAASEIEGVFDGVRNLLTAIAKADSVQALDVPACIAYLAKLQPEVPHLISMAVIDRDGLLRCRSPMPESPVSYADRGYVQDALRTASFAIGGFTQARIAKQAVLPFALPFRDARGEIAGVVATALDLQWLSARLHERGLPPGGSITIADKEGVILAREPFPERFIATRIPDNFLHLVKADAPGALDVMSQDGTLRVLGYAPSPSIYVSAGLSAEASYEGVERLMRQGLIVIGCGFILAMLCAWLFGRLFIERPVNRLLAATDAWRAGDLTVRTGFAARGEFGRLGQAFDRAIEELSRRDANQKLLMDELNHRVKNTLATVQSIASQTLRSARDPEGFKEAFEARLLALSRTHDLLTKSQWQAASLRELLEKELAPYRERAAAQYHLAGIDILVGPRVALALGLAFHELTTNAVKHGALSQAGGRVDIGWHVTASKETNGALLHLEWRETGGPPVAPPQKKGFGSRLLERSLTSELNGSIKTMFDRAGLVCLIAIPVPDEHVSGEAPERDAEAGALETSLTSSPLLPMSG